MNQRIPTRPSLASRTARASCAFFERFYWPITAVVVAIVVLINL